MDDWLESEEFYNAMQGYRCAPMADQREVVAHFENVKRQLRAHNMNGRLEMFRAEMTDMERRMAKLSGEFLKLGAYEDSAKCAMRADVFKLVLGRLPPNVLADRPAAPFAAGPATEGSEVERRVGPRETGE